MSHSLIFFQNSVESTVFITLSREIDIALASFYGLTWDAIKQNSSPHPTKLARTPLYSHMSSIKACSSRLNQVLIDILYSRYVHSILLSHSFYTNLTRRVISPKSKTPLILYINTHFAPLLYICFPFFLFLLFFFSPLCFPASRIPKFFKIHSLTPIK